MGSKTSNLFNIFLALGLTLSVSAESAFASVPPIDNGSVAGGHSDAGGNIFADFGQLNSGGLITPSVAVGNMLSPDFGQQLTDFGINQGLDAIGIGGGNKPAGSSSGGSQGGMNDAKIRCAAQKLLTLMEGNLGALIMVVAGIGTIIASAFGAFRAATSLLAVAIGAFVLRSFVEIFFDAGLDNTPASCNLAGSVATDRGMSGG